jgi:hypothetical protein
MSTPTINYSALAFFMANQNRYRELWEVLGRNWATLPFEAAWARVTIPGKNHGSIKITLTEAQKKAMLPILASMGFFKELKLGPGTYDELHVTGAKYKGMRDRVADIVRRLNRGDYKFGRITCQVGQRPRQIALKDGTPMDGTIEEIIAGLSPNVLRNPWVQREIAKLSDHGRPAGTSDEDRDLWWGPFATEYELMILAFIIAYDGDVEVGEYEAIEEAQRFENIPARTFASCTLTLPDGTPVLVLNAPAVEREHGDPRPTTTSSTEYWLERYSPKDNAKIVGVSGPTHGYRVIHDFEINLHKVKPGVTVHGMSRPAGNPMAVINNALGEAVFLLIKAWDEVSDLMSGKEYGAAA